VPRYGNGCQQQTPMTTDEGMLDGCIDDQRNAIRYFVIFAGGLIALGVTITVMTLLLTRDLAPDAFKSFLGSGGGFVATLSAFPLKEVLTRREKQRALVLLRTRLAGLSGLPDATAVAERTQIKTVLWKLVEKTAVG